MNKIKYNESWRYPIKALFNITDGCNMECKYCFVQQNPHYMSYETGVKAIDWIVENYNIQIENKWFGDNPSSCNIYFFGGEPTLLFYQIIEPLVKYCKQTYPTIPINFGITTNASLLDDYMINFFKDNNFAILISIDGIKEVQDYNRPLKNGQSSFDVIAPRLKKIIDNIPWAMARSTFIPSSCQYLFSSYLFLEACGFKKVFFAPNVREEWSEENINTLKEQIRKIFMYRTNQYLLNENIVEYGKIDFTYEQILYHDLKFLNLDFYSKILKENECNPVRCGTGLGDNGISIGYDGKIYGCQEQPSIDKKNLFLIGDLYNNNIDKERHLQLIQLANTAVFKTEECNNCVYELHCKNTNCLSAKYQIHNNFNNKTYFECLWNQIVTEECLIQMKILTDKNCQSFKEYVEGFRLCNNVLKERRGKNVNLVQ